MLGIHVYSAGDGTCPAPIDNSQVSNKMVAGLRDWEQDDHGLPVMAYMLSHRYCEASFSFQLLKGTDRAITEVLLEASKQKSFCLYLGTVTMTESLYPGDGDEDSDHKIDVFSSLTADSLVSTTGETIKSIKLYHKAALVPHDVFKDVKPDNEEFRLYYR